MLCVININGLAQTAKTENTNLNEIDGLYQAFTKGNIPKVLDLMDVKIIWNEAESNSLAIDNPYIGPEAILHGVFIKLGELYKFFGLRNIKLHEMSNNQVLATLNYEIISKDGKSYTVQVVHPWTLKDGKIIQFQQYADTKKLAEAEN
ncbi:nuclear transport factor 2 family protein [Winogradskyella bathintestinalis]|uniref:Nuclear transport factor 2 family protein n=1 Tax=Winogradskyella bathintestinalis TaxID=3035208 RepID=A0ABT7ZVD3_9FLAO|nr:nuclear transport factor 2 family protein [Winogradskyella bathintestinalis]MDN3492928.1 nuclear transport factor 2 family protein [Winogradskyella bathintestinalis]